MQGSSNVWEVNCNLLRLTGDIHPPTPCSFPAGSLDVEEACRGFLDLAKEAAAACVAVVFSDPAFAELFQRLYSRCDDGRVVGSRVGMGRERRWRQGAGSVHGQCAHASLAFPVHARSVSSHPALPCSSDDWRTGGLTASVLATLEDFLQVGHLGGLVHSWGMNDGVSLHNGLV